MQELCKRLYNDILERVIYFTGYLYKTKVLKLTKAGPQVCFINEIPFYGICFSFITFKVICLVEGEPMLKRQLFMLLACFNYFLYEITL